MKTPPTVAILDDGATATFCEANRVRHSINFSKLAKSEYNVDVSSHTTLLVEAISSICDSSNFVSVRVLCDSKTCNFDELIDGLEWTALNSRLYNIVTVCIALNSPYVWHDKRFNKISKSLELQNIKVFCAWRSVRAVSFPACHCKTISVCQNMEIRTLESFDVSYLGKIDVFVNGEHPLRKNTYGSSVSVAILCGVFLRAFQRNSNIRFLGTRNLIESIGKTLCHPRYNTLELVP